MCRLGVGDAEHTARHGIRRFVALVVGNTAYYFGYRLQNVRLAYGGDIAWYLKQMNVIKTVKEKKRAGTGTQQPTGDRVGLPVGGT